MLGVEAFVDGLYKALPKGGVIARFGVGHDGVDKIKATENDLIVTNTPGVLDDSVAEHAIWLVGALARQIAAHDASMKQKNWQPCSGMELKGKTLLLIGCGAIGRKTAKIASFGFGMKVIAYDVVKCDAEMMKTQFGVSAIAGSLDEVLSHADVVSIHMPSIPATRHFVDSGFLYKMKQTACIINTSRGPIIDEIALYDALVKKQIAGAGLDVFETEPYKPVDAAKDLRTLDNIVLTPHVGSSTTDACNRMAHRVLENLKAGLEKRYKDMDILNPAVLERFAK